MIILYNKKKTENKMLTLDTHPDIINFFLNDRLMVLSNVDLSN